MSSIADRVRHHRARQRAGRICVLVEIDESETGDFLVNTRFLDWNLTDNREALGNAVGELVRTVTTRRSR